MRAFWIRLALVWAALLSAIPAHAQAIQQSGAVTKFHAPAWFSNGWAGDAGGTGNPGINNLGLFNGSNCPLGISSQTSPGVSTSAYGLFTICQSTTGASINVTGVNGNPSPTLTINVGGVSYPFPGPGTGDVVGPSSSVANTPACYANTTGKLIGSCPAASAGTFIGLGSAIPTLNLASAVASGTTNFFTTGFYTSGDGGGANYYYQTGSAQPGDQVSADGVRLSLSLSQQLTWEQLGAPTTGWIGTASISGTTLTATNTQSGALAIGETITAAGGTGGVSAGTTITAGSGSVWTVNNSQSVSSTVMVGGDSYPYFGAAQLLGHHGVAFTGNHYFSQSIMVNGNTVAWEGPNGRLDRGYSATLFFPSGYGGLFVGPPNAIVSAQGDISYTGNVVFGGGVGSIFRRFRIQVGDGNRPAALTNNRPCLGVYTSIQTDALTLKGCDGDGRLVNGDTTHTISDTSVFRDTTVINVSGNGTNAFGGDANANADFGLLVSAVGLSCIYDHSFLANSYSRYQVQGCGSTATTVRRTNNLYDSVQDNNLNNDPLSSPSFWALRQASVGVDTWSSGTTYNVGATMRTSGGGNASTFNDGYSEGGYQPALFQAASNSHYLTNINGGLLSSGINTTQSPVFSGYNTYGRAFTVFGYGNSGYAFDTLGGSTFEVGYRANNVNSGPGSATAGVFDAAVNSIGYSRFGGKAVGSHRAGYITAWNAANSPIDVQYWDGEGLLTAPFTDNTTSNGISTKRWASNFSTLYRPGAGTATWTSQAGTPEGSLTATGGSFVTDTATGFGYLKTTVASGNTGYKQIAIAGAYTAAPLTLATSRLLGRTTASTGAAEEITVGTGLTLSGGSLTLTSPRLTGTTGSIGGGALGAAACTTGTASVSGATTSMAVAASPVTYPGDGNYWLAYVSSADTVTVAVCSVAGGTPTASTYNVRVLQ